MLSNNNITPPLGLIKPSKSELIYTLVVVQQPERARCCGFGEKDKRPIDPPPIVQLKASLHGREISLTMADTKLFSLHCDIYSEDTLQQYSLVYPPPYYSPPKNITRNNELILTTTYTKNLPVRNLLGSIISNAYCLTNLEGEQGVYFIFHDLSVRTEGTFTLQFRFLDLDAGEPMTMSTAIQAEVFSKPFRVDTPKNFTGMSKATELSKTFSNQGVKIITRKPSNIKRKFSM